MPNDKEAKSVYPNDLDAAGDSNLAKSDTAEIALERAELLTATASLACT